MHYNFLELDDLMNIDELSHQLKKLFSSQRLAVLATQCEGEPYANLVAFAATEDLRRLVFATNRGTRKFTNLMVSPNAAFLIDNRSNEVADFTETMAVTAMGLVPEAKERERDELMRLFLIKHPNLREFVTSPECALIKTTVSAYYVVTSFQKVMKLDVESWSLFSR